MPTRADIKVRTSRVLPQTFYDRPTLDVAADLLGKVLAHRKGAVVTSGVIVETEAYIGESDPACHAASGPTRRNAPLYGPPGRAYVYLNYGIHCLVNVVTESEGRPAAVLIRALAPLDGLAMMRRRRHRLSKGRRTRPSRWLDDEMCRGPGNLTMAMGITLGENRLDVSGSRLWIEDRGHRVGPIVWTPRIGIRVGTDRLWRVHVRDHPSVSGPR